MTPEQEKELGDLAQALRAVGKGPMDWIYELIFDIESYLQGDRTIVNPNELLETARAQLALRTHKLGRSVAE